ncbi:hypothetical protein JL721_1751 [Aureococcus anophagefferens]|nr:hypothetical protein JL721_1751 [Aureococcus anophagefferens]
MHRRRGVGVKAVKKKAQEKESYASKAAEMEATEAAHVGAFLATFRRSLEAFAAKHKRGIREDPVFRRQFTAMCYETGVDPLRSSKGFWAEALGVGDFYYEVGVKVVECCAATRGENGGLIAIDDLLDRVGDDAISRDDVKRAVAKLAALGDGFRVINGDAILSAPAEFSDDAARASRLRRWRRRRSGRCGGPQRRQLAPGGALRGLVDGGFAWVDDQAPARAYCFPSVWLDARQKLAAG